MLGLGTSVNRGGFVSAADPLLLDTYSGAAAAFSLRKLSSTYSGPALQIRRASDNVEVDVSFDTNGVVSLNSLVTNVTEETSGTSPDPDSTSATTLGEFVANASYTDADSLGSTDSALVQCWYDQSGNSKDATQDTAGSQPTIVSSGVLVTENGKPAVEFDASNDTMVSSFSSSSNYSVFQVFAQLQILTSGNLFSTIDYGTSGAKSGFQVRSSQYFVRGNGGNFGSQDLNQNLIEVTHDSGQFDCVKNGTSIASASSTLVAIDGVTINRLIGSARYASGKWQELIVYPSSQSSNRTDIESNINTFYSIF